MPVIDRQQLQVRVDDIGHRGPAVGLAVGVVRLDAPPVLCADGSADIASRAPVTPNTAFSDRPGRQELHRDRIDAAVGAGPVDLDGPANDSLLGYRLVPAESGWRPATVRHLLAPTAGVPEWVHPSGVVHRDWCGRSDGEPPEVPTGSTRLSGVVPRVSAMRCEVRVRGSLPANVLDELGGMRAFTVSGVAVLRGAQPDQSALIGVINRLHCAGVDLREVRLLGPNGHIPLSTESASTVLRGSVPDQETLIRIIGRQQGFGIDLRELRQLDPSDSTADPPGGSPDQNGMPRYEILVAQSDRPRRRSVPAAVRIDHCADEDGAQRRGGRARALSMPRSPPRMSQAAPHADQPDGPRLRCASMPHRICS